GSCRQAGSWRSPEQGGGGRAGRHATAGPSVSRNLFGGLQAAGRFLARTRVAFDLVGDLLVFVERAQVRDLDGRGVDENVLAAVVRLDEAVALGGVVPFHSAGSHFQDLR